MLVERKPLKDLIIIRLNPGDDVLASLQEAVKKNNINNAVIVSGFGSVRNHHFHVVASRENPPAERYIREDLGSDIIDVTGCIINGRVHVHITHSDSKYAFGGHLEPGVEVLTFLNIFMAEVDYDFREFDAIGNIEDLRKK